jgi:hypothetical protein
MMIPVFSLRRERSSIYPRIGRLERSGVVRQPETALRDIRSRRLLQLEAALRDIRSRRLLQLEATLGDIAQRSLVLGRFSRLGRAGAAGERGDGRRDDEADGDTGANCGVHAASVAPTGIPGACDRYTSGISLESGP